MRLAAAAGIAVLAVSLALLATGRRNTEPLPEHPGIAAGGAKLTYRAQAAEPLPLLRSPLQCRGGAGGANIGRRLLAADWLTTPPVPGSLGPHWDQASCLACHLEGLPRAAASRRRPPPVVQLLHPQDLARYGAQVNLRALPGLAPQGRVVVRWETSPLRLADGSEVRLRRPRVDVVAADGGEPPALAGPVLVQAQRYLGVPDRRRRGAADTDRGRVLFERLGCHACHLQVMTTGAAVAEALADQVIWPYSDLLLHDSAAGSP